MNALEIDYVSKKYRLGEISTGTLSHDLHRWWCRIRGKDDPYLLLGDVNNRAEKAISDYIWALREITFEVRPGDILGIIGSNGAGKSTLLKILSKITSPTSGEIRFRGRMASLLEVGTGFHPEMTGRENIYMNGAIMGMTRAEITRKLDEIIDFSGVARYIDTPVKRYSSGMLVRLGFAVAAHLESEILIVDEVLAVGDAEFQEKALGKMRDVTTSDGRTVLFVSHNMGAVKTLCKRGIVLDQGRLVYDGKTDEAISFYQKCCRKEMNDKQTIREAGVRVSPDIEIFSIRINGRETMCPVLDDFENVLKIEVSGRIEKRTRLEIEGRVFDENEVPLAMFSPGHNRRKYKMYEKGLFFLQETIYLSSGIHRGNYYLCLDITNPGVEYFFRVPPRIRLEIPGFISVKGNVFEYRNGNGFIQLFDEQYLLETEKLSRLQ